MTTAAIPNARPTTLIDAVLPRHTVWRDVALVAGFSAFVALTAQVTIPLQPVPITGQTLGVLLTALALGPRLGGLSIALYLLEGLAGLPVFAGGRSAWSPSSAPGLPVILGPTAGYLLSYLPASIALGWLAQRGWARSVPLTFAGMLVASAIIYAVGLAWLARFTGAHTLELGLIPFIPGDAIKAVVAALLLPAAWRLTGRR